MPSSGSEVSNEHYATEVSKLTRVKDGTVPDKRGEASHTTVENISF